METTNTFFDIKTTKRGFLSAFVTYDDPCTALPVRSSSALPTAMCETIASPSAESPDPRLTEIKGLRGRYTSKLGPVPINY